MVPFRQAVHVGWAAGPAPPRPGARSLLSVVEREPSAPADLLALARWMADYYVAPLGMVLKAMTPAGLTDRSRQRLVPLRAPGPSDDLGPRDQEVLAAVGSSRRGRAVASVRRRAGSAGFWPAVRQLVARGLVGHATALPKLEARRARKTVRLTRSIGTLEEMDRAFGRAVRQREAFQRLEEAGGRLALAALLDAGFSRGVVAGLVARGLAEMGEESVHRDPFRDGAPGGWEASEGAAAPPLVPAPAQAQALAALRTALDKGGAFLLHGATGSGKTLVYVELLKDVLARGKSAVVLVPEIALTPQTVSRFREAFGDRVAVLHSGLSGTERHDAWRMLKAGEKRVAIGARSAVFAPVVRLGAVVVDEEHDGGYKQSEAPSYQARDVALVRAARSGAVCVLGSATPSLESWANAKSGKLALLSMPERVGGGSLPEVRVADLRAARPAAPGSAGVEQALPSHVVSPQLATAIQARLRRREQVILLLNRRGYASFALCLACGTARQCRDCSVSMTLHRGRGAMVCHHCGRTESVPERCGECGSPSLSFRGLGTEQVERVLVEAVPGVRVARMDADTTGGKWARHEILGRFRDGAVDVLVGTQMVAKGLDFHRVTLVGVINADVGLNLPDFRASERAFQLLAQVSGRTGRGRLAGEVVVQTYVPDHPVVRAAVAHDYTGFVERELRARRDPPYPPTVRLARIVLSGESAQSAVSDAERLAKWLETRKREELGGRGPDRPPRSSGRRKRETLAVLGPAPAPIEKLRGRFRWHLLLRGSAAAVGRALRAVSAGFAPGAGVRMSLDRDPSHMM